MTYSDRRIGCRFLQRRSLRWRSGWRLGGSWSLSVLSVSPSEDVGSVISERLAIGRPCHRGHRPIQAPGPRENRRHDSHCHRSESGRRSRRFSAERSRWVACIPRSRFRVRQDHGSRSWRSRRMAVHVLSGAEGMSHDWNATCFPDQFDRFCWGQFHDFNERRFSSSEETGERFADRG